MEQTFTIVPDTGGAVGTQTQSTSTLAELVLKLNGKFFREGNPFIMYHIFLDSKKVGTLHKGNSAEDSYFLPHEEVSFNYRELIAC